MDNGQLFKDAINRWSSESIRFVAARGLFKGTSNTEFSPTSHMTRGMLVTILHRLDSEPAPNGQSRFSDVANGKWYSQAVAWAAENKIVSGTSNATFSPNGMATREQFCVMLYNYIRYLNIALPAEKSIGRFMDHEDISTWALPAVTWATANGLFSGTPENLLEPKELITREQAAVIMERMVKLLLS